MRFTRPSSGDVRIKKGFLLFPKKLKTKQGVLVTRWLETAEWQQQYIVGFSSSFWASFWSDRHWTDIE